MESTPLHHRVTELGSSSPTGVKESGNSCVCAHKPKQRVAYSQKGTSCWRGCEKKGTLLPCWWECKLVQPLWIIVWRILKKLKIELPYDPAIPLMGLYLEKTIIQKDTCRSQDGGVGRHWVSISPQLGCLPAAGGGPWHPRNWEEPPSELVTQVQEAERVPYRINPRKNTPRQILIKLKKLNSKKN